MRDLTKGNLTRQMVMFTLPIFAGNLLQQLYNFVDSIIVGNFIGKEALAAVGNCGSIINILIAILIGLDIATEILIAKEIGGMDFNKAGIIANTMFLLIMSVALIIGIFGFILAPKLLYLMKTPPELIPMAEIYLKVYFFGILGIAGYNTLNGIIRSTGDAFSPLIFLGIASVLNIFLDLLFVCVFKMGVAGAAFATVISQGFSFFLCFMHLPKVKKELRIHLKKENLCISFFKEGLRLGIPSGMQQASSAIALLVIQIVVNSLKDTDSISAYLIGMKVDSFAGLPAVSLGFALTTIVSQNLGAGKVKRVREASIRARIFSIIMGLILCFLLRSYREEIVSLFVSNDEKIVIYYGAKYIELLSIMYPLACYFSVVHGILNGKGKTFVTMMVQMSSMWIVRIPLAIILTKRIGFIGICYAIPISWFFSFIATEIYELIYRSKNNGKVL